MLSIPDTFRLQIIIDINNNALQTERRYNTINFLFYYLLIIYICNNAFVIFTNNLNIPESFKSISVK